ncbi:MAG: transposase [Thermodesulfobacteriota bacterium]|nr:transposase [Thermodesulfobacteriota bacterium]
MLEKESMEPRIIRKMEEMEGVCRTTGISSIKETKNIQGIRTVPDPEVRERAVRRRFTAEYKLRILKEAESCKEQGQLGSLLRREGLYSSNLITWQRQMEKGTLEALSPRKRGPKAKRPDPSARRIAELERENQKLKKKLRQAETIIDVQKKISEILQIPLTKNGEMNS